MHKGQSILVGRSAALIWQQQFAIVTSGTCDGKVQACNRNRVHGGGCPSSEVHPGLCLCEFERKVASSGRGDAMDLQGLGPRRQVHGGGNP